MPAPAPSENTETIATRSRVMLADNRGMMGDFPSTMQDIAVALDPAAVVGAGYAATSDHPCRISPARRNFLLCAIANGAAIETNQRTYATHIRAGVATLQVRFGLALQRAGLLERVAPHRFRVTAAGRTAVGVAEDAA